MPTKTTLRVLIIAEILLGAASMVAYFVGEPSLPEGLRDFESDRFEDPSLPTLLTMLGFVALLLVALLVSWVGLFLFWRPARLIYLLVTLAGLLALPFLGPYVETGLSYALGQAAGIVAGIILAAVYWSPLKELYMPPATQVSGPEGPAGSMHSS